MAYWQVRAKLNDISYINKFIAEDRWELLSEEHKKSKVFEKVINSIQQNELMFLVDEEQKINYYARCKENKLDGINIKVDKWKKTSYTVEALNGGYFIRTIFAIKKQNKIEELLTSLPLNIEKIDKIKIKNFRLFKELEMNFNKDLNVIIADNGAGKTTILDAIATGFGAMLTRFPNIQGFSFKQQDLHINENNQQEPYMKIEINSIQNTFWDRVYRKNKTIKYSSYGVKELYYVVDSSVKKEEANESYQMPLIIYYGTNRSIFNPTTEKNSLKNKSFTRFSSLDGALTSSSTFKHFFDWFYFMQQLEQSKIIEKKDFDFKLPELIALKETINNMLPQCENPRMKIQRGKKTVEFIIDKKEIDGTIKEFNIEQLSAGYKMVLSMVMDISARMSQANSHLGNNSEAIILIDELDLHLHPKWQQTILSDLRRTFPNAQFIVTTHSPQILTTVKKENIFILEEGTITKPFDTPYAKRSIVALEDLMSTNSRPPLDEVDLLDRYLDKIHQGDIDSDDILSIREKLNDLYGKNYQQLLIADMIINKHIALRNR